VKDLEVRLAALDPDAGAAMRVITYFDELTAGRAGLQAIVRGAAVLAGCPARLIDESRRLSLRAEPDGAAGNLAGPLAAWWLSAAIGPDGGAQLWLERPGPAGPVEAMVLERAAVAAQAVLERTRGRVPARADGAHADDALAEVLIDETASAGDRLHAARRLGLAEDDRARAIALAGAGPLVLPANQAGLPANGPRAGVDPGTGIGLGAGIGPRAGIGPAVGVLRLPESWAAARIALRLTAEGTPEDPGPRTVLADDLGGLALLAAGVTATAPPVPDELALEHAAAAAPWMLATLDAVASSPSMRAAAAGLRVHHSTLQERITHAERLLGWSIRHPEGSHRLYLALAIRRLRRHPPA
jgi:hypothetical protein